MLPLRVLRIASATVALFSVARAQDSLQTRQIDLTLTEGTSMSAAASPDGRQIVFDLLGALWVMPIRGGEAKKITPEFLEARQPTWSPDGRTIAFQGYDTDGVWHIYTIAHDGGEARPITKGPFNDREPAWSHDGTSIAFSSDRFGGISTIWILPASGGEARRISNRDGVMPAWSPNDQEITFASRDKEDDLAGVPGRPIIARQRRPTSGLWAVDLVQRREHLIWVEPRAGAGSWNPDGTQVAFTTTDGRLSLAVAGLADAAVSLVVKARNLSANEDVFPFRPQWISRTELLYTAGGHIKRRSLSGIVSTIPFQAPVSLVRSTYPIAHRSLEQTEAQRVTGINNPVMSPDGTLLVFTALGDLWLTAPGGAGDPVRLTNDPFVELDPAWSPDGRRLAYSSDRGGTMDVWVHDFRTNEDSQVTAVRHGDSATGAAWSPDGASIAFLVNGRGPSIVSSRSGAPVTRVAAMWSGDVIGERSRPTWSADGHVLVVGSLFPYSDRYRDGLTQLLLYALDPVSMFSTALFPAHSSGNRDGNGPVWSPDGFRMAFVTEGTLWTVPVDEKGGATGPPLAVTDDEPAMPSWEGDSRHLLYQSARGLRRVLVDGGIPEPIPLEMAWKPSAPPERVVVHAGHVFDGVFSGLSGETDIVIEHGVIRSITGHSDGLHVGNVVDASNEVVIPGLIDMRVRLDRGYGQNFGRVLLAYGITSVRMPGVNPHEALEQRESFDAGRRVGPRLFFAGDTLDGARVTEVGGAAVTSEPQLAREIDRANTLGVDLFSTGPRLADRYQKQIVDLAHAVGKPVTSTEIYPAVAIGVDGIEHLRGPSRRGYSPKISETERVYGDVVELLTKSGVWLSPTLGLEGGFAARINGDRSVLNDPRLALLSRTAVTQLHTLVTGPRLPLLEMSLRPFETSLKTIATGGGRIVAGSGAPAIPYGLGLHVELENYVRAGLSAYQALQTATINAAQALGVDTELGTIEVGKLGDLTFLGGDPLVDIRNTRDVRRVMKTGRVYNVAELLASR